MTLPNIPTDNLYKFLFIAGLTTIIASIIIFLSESRTITNKIDNVSLSLVKDEAESESLSEDIKELSSDLDQIDKGLSKMKVDTVTVIPDFEQFKSNILNDKDYRDYLSFMYEHKEDILPYYKENINAQKKNELNIEKQRQLVLNSKIRKLGLEQIRREWYSFLWLSIFVFIFIIIGYFMTKFGYKKWYELVQKPSDEKLRLELIQLKKEIQDETT